VREMIYGLTVLRSRAFSSRSRVSSCRTRSCSRTCSRFRLLPTSSSTDRTTNTLCDLMGTSQMIFGNYFACWFHCEQDLCPIFRCNLIPPKAHHPSGYHDLAAVGVCAQALHDMGLP
jgi:hypothetical protein